MDPIIGGSLISGAASLIGGAFSSSRSGREARLNRKMQKEFAQHGIRWRVEDAKAAGLHPLYALGAQTPSFSPVYSSDSIGPALADAGQSIGRAVAAQSTPHEKVMAQLQLRAAEQQLEEGDARIGLLKSEAMRNRLESLSRIGMPSLGDPVDPNIVPSGMEGQAPNQGMSKVVPSQVIASDPREPFRTAGVQPGMTRYDTGLGFHVDLPSAQGGAAESMESLESPWTALPVLLVNTVRFGKWAAPYIVDAVMAAQDIGSDTKERIVKSIREAEQHAAQLRMLRR